MRLEGYVKKDSKSKYWITEVPALDVMTQGTSKENAYYMITDAIEALVDKKGFIVNIRPSAGDTFTIGASDEKLLIALLLRRFREAHGFTLMEMAKKLGVNSPNAYGRYEQGKSMPSQEKLEELLAAIDPSYSLVLKRA